MDITRAVPAGKTLSPEHRWMKIIMGRGIDIDEGIFTELNILPIDSSANGIYLPILLSSSTSLNIMGTKVNLRNVSFST